MSADEDFIATLIEAEKRNPHTSSECRVCDALSEMSEEVAVHVRRALTGTIGRDRLALILASGGYKVGRRSVERHRSEGHK